MRLNNHIRYWQIEQRDHRVNDEKVLVTRTDLEIVSSKISTSTL